MMVTVRVHCDRGSCKNVQEATAAGEPPVGWAVLRWQARIRDPEVEARVQQATAIAKNVAKSVPEEMRASVEGLLRVGMDQMRQGHGKLVTYMANLCPDCVDKIGLNSFHLFDAFDVHGGGHPFVGPSGDPGFDLSGGGSGFNFGGGGGDDDDDDDGPPIIIPGTYPPQD